MPLIHGYTPKSIGLNAEREIQRGKPYRQAVAIAFEEARRAWRHAHPWGAYPAHLRGMRKKTRRSANRSQGSQGGLTEHDEFVFARTVRNHKMRFGDFGVAQEEVDDLDPGDRRSLQRAVSHGLLGSPVRGVRPVTAEGRRIYDEVMG